AWLIRVTVNAALKQLRRRKFISDNSENELDAAAVDFDFSDRSDIIKAVHSLPTKLRTVIMLYYYDDMSSSEISRLLKIPQSTVTTRLSRGRKALKELLKGEYDYE
ncbi:MAG: RNA polymerase sigma factor, partial [Oscillospiraceae bacterium]|nr:RNA polymerase sigma factor [Oscillospiraceae bacterium]